jgi:iron complex transport system substrate-binding protein
MTTRTTARWGRFTVAGVVAILLSGCAGTASPPAPTTEPGIDAPGRTSYPVTVINCGVNVTFTAPPQRAVVIDSAPMELLAGIGVKQGIAATVGVRGKRTRYIPEWALSVPSVQDKVVPTVAQEVLLGQRPDAIITSFDERFTVEGSGLRADWTARGVPMFVPQAGCTDPTQADYSLDGVVSDVLDLGVIFDRQAEAEQLAGTLTSRIAAATQQSTGQAVDVFVYDSGQDTPFTCCGGTGAAALTATGGQDIFADLGRGSHKVSWDQVVTRNPEAIMIIDYSNGQGDDGAKKLAFLKSFPALAGTRAVRNDRFLVLNDSTFSTSLTLVDDLQRMADFLKEVRGGS